MKVSFTGQFKMIPKQLMRKCGYHEFIDPNTRELSYVCPLSGGLYPRFHVYLEPKEKGFFLNLHLDQKHASYGGSHAHAGEYDGEVVEKEGRRIQAWMESLRLS